MPANTFPASEDYRQPDCDAICDLLNSGTDVIGDVSDWRSSVDNRTAIRLLLMLRGVASASFAVLVEPYDNGYYKRADGKSSPFGIFKIARFQKVLGFRKDIVAIRHDLDYYRGVERKEADKRYLDLQIELGYQGWRARAEYAALRSFGAIAWRAHKKKRERIPGYGTDQYIPSLPVYPPQD